MMWSSLPHDILLHIYGYLPWQSYMGLTKHNYLLFHPFFIETVEVKKQDSLLRQIIRLDYSFVFSLWAQEKSMGWCRRKKYRFGGKTFVNYMTFLQTLCLEKQASKCLDCLR
jgi:hypothetical protein